MKVNMADTQVNNFDPVPKGIYHVAATDVEVRESGPNSKNPGSEYANWELTIQEGLYEGRKIWTMTSFLPQALFSLKGLALASGKFTEAQLNEEIDTDDILEECEGSEFLVRVVIKSSKEYDDKNEVKAFYKLGEKPLTVHTPEGAKASANASLKP